MPTALLSVLGMTPAVLTETLWAVRHETPPDLPDRIEIVTTTMGCAALEQELLGPEGALARFYRDYGVAPVPLACTVARTVAGRALEDVRTAEDSAALADAVVAKVAALVREPGLRIHASLAGGRKTMSFHLGYAMTLLGRPQDRLTHVLVSPVAFETPGFYYPPPDRGVVRVPRPRGRPGETVALDTREVRIDLGDVPFLRLGEHVPESLRAALADPARHVGHAELVASMQAALAPAEIVLDDGRRTVRVGGHEVRLPPREYALLRVYADGRRCSAVHRRDGWAEDGGWLAADGFTLRASGAAPPRPLARYLEIYAGLPGRSYAGIEALAATLKAPSVTADLEEYFRRLRSLLNTALETRLRFAWLYRDLLLQESRTRLPVRHRLACPPERLRILAAGAARGSGRTGAERRAPSDAEAPASPAPG